jgi:hypothetical protein
MGMLDNDGNTAQNAKSEAEGNYVIVINKGRQNANCISICELICKKKLI